VYLRLGGVMQPGYPFILNLSQWALVAFVLAMAFLSGVLGGYLCGLTHAERHSDGSQGSKSIWTYDDED
jgi:hypothetical protein